MTFFLHPFLILRGKCIKSIIYPRVRFYKPKYLKLLNSTIAYGATIKCFCSSKSESTKIEIINSWIGEYDYISSGGNISIQGAILAPNVFIGSYKHNINPNAGFGAEEKQYTILLEEGCRIFQNVSIVGNVRIGRYAVVGAGSIVTKDIPDYCLAVGNPAKVIKRYNLKSKCWEKAN
ncbi:MAG: acyltransferase [Bacilli bacterium]|jgi:acetyltransferase-like isoleucine patch superfamily enzyme|nr:acyltransferase [Bacilli bacterium]